MKVFLFIVLCFSCYSSYSQDLSGQQRCDLSLSASANRIAKRIEVNIEAKGSVNISLLKIKGDKSYLVDKKDFIIGKRFFFEVNEPVLTEVTVRLILI